MMAATAPPISEVSGPGHGILYGVREKKQQREVERGHLPDLTLAAETYAEQHQQIDRSRPQHNLQQDVAARKDYSPHA